MPNIFDEANRASEELFAEETAPEEPIQEEVPQDIPAEEVPAEETVPEETVPQELTPEQATLEDATNTAEMAAQVAAEKDAELTALRQQMEAMQQQNQDMYATIEELSRRNQEQIVKEALEPPVLDISSLAFADEDTIKQAQLQYAQAMAEYNRQAFMKEFAPVIEQANKQKYAEEKNEVISALSQIPELKGIGDMIPQLDRIIASNKALSSDNVPMDEKYITAFAIASGVNSINTPPVEPKEPTVEELMALYNNNPEFQEMVERQRIDQVKNSQQVPPMSASSGAVNAALDIKKEPKGWGEANKRTRSMFGLE